MSDEPAEEDHPPMSRAVAKAMRRFKLALARRALRKKYEAVVEEKGEDQC